MEDFGNTLTSWKWFMHYRKSHDKGDAKPWSDLSRGRLRHNLREAEEERGGANEEESGRRHRDIPGGTQGSAVRHDGVGEWRWGWNPPSTLTAATWHHFLRRISGCCGVSFTTSQRLRQVYEGGNVTEKMSGMLMKGLCPSHGRRAK